MGARLYCKKCKQPRSYNIVNEAGKQYRRNRVLIKPKKGIAPNHNKKREVDQTLTTKLQEESANCYENDFILIEECQSQHLPQTPTSEKEYLSAEEDLPYLFNLTPENIDNIIVGPSNNIVTIDLSELDIAPTQPQPSKPNIGRGRANANKSSPNVGNSQRERKPPAYLKDYKTN